MSSIQTYSRTVGDLARRVGQGDLHLVKDLAMAIRADAEALQASLRAEVDKARGA